jgi:hypothetical protein
MATGGTGAGTGGSSGSGGSGGGGSQSGCDPASCDEPLIGEVCCTDRDECGYRLLLSCLPQL